MIISDWHELLPFAIQSLNPFHQALVGYVMNQPGKRRPSYKHALNTWSLDRDQFDGELADAFRFLRIYLKRLGITKSDDLDIL